MPIFDWSTSILGYPRHHRSGSAMVGLSHMIVHDALRFALEAELGCGWLLLSNVQPQFENLPEGEPIWADLGDLFTTERIAYTEGVVHGAVTYVASDDRERSPPTDRQLTTWAEEVDYPWIQMIDNECTYWGCVGESLAIKLLRWFCCQHPIDQPWTAYDFEPDTARFLVEGLFQHGWTRNVALVTRSGQRAVQDLWGGLHAHSILDHDVLHSLAKADVGVRLELTGDDAWQGAIVDDDTCPLHPETGRVVRQR